MNDDLWMLTVMRSRPDAFLHRLGDGRAQVYRWGKGGRPEELGPACDTPGEAWAGAARRLGLRCEGCGE